ncbi:M3 family oligoendopeptidase [Mycoplasma sp. 613B]
MKSYKKYSDIPEKYRFDLESLLENKKIEVIIQEYWISKNEELKYKDSKYENIESFIYFKELENKNELKLNKIINYLSNKLSINSVDPIISKIQVKFENDLDEFNKQNGSEINRLYKNIDKVKEWIKDERLKSFKYELTQILDFQKHKLSDEIENFLLDINKANPDFSEIFQVLSDVETDLGYGITSKNKKIKITHSNYSLLMKNKDRNLRKTTFNSYLNSYFKNKNTYAKLLIQHFSRISTFALKRKYNSSVESFISEDYIEENMLQTLFNNVKKLKPLLKKFQKYDSLFFKAKFNQKKEYYDSFVDLVDKKEIYSVEEAQEIYKKSLSIMGQEYNDVSQKAFNERWIDYMNCDGKTSGAYSISNAYGLDKIFISMNWDYTLESVLTLAHEMGHSMHTYYSNKNQDQNNAEYPILLAEIASIFNELVVSDYLKENAKNDLAKLQILRKNIQDFISTVVKQTFWSNYEYHVYNAIDKNQEISTFDDLAKIYSNTYKEYFASGFKNEKSLIFATIVPHFYLDFYVYKYAIGFLVANYFFNDYKINGPKSLENYIHNFLSAGGKDKPSIILQEAGINLKNDDLYINSFQILSKNIEEYTKLGKKIFKVS